MIPTKDITLELAPTKEIPIELNAMAFVSEARDLLGRWAAEGGHTAIEGLHKAGEVAEKVLDAHEHLEATDHLGKLASEHGIAKKVYHKFKELLEKAEEHVSALGHKTWDQLPMAVKKVLSPLAHAYRSIGRGLDKVHKIGQAVAVEIMAERKLEPAQAAKLAHILHSVDTIFKYTVSGGIGKAVTHLGGPAGFAVGEAFKALPMASLAYVGYSTARNPLATIRASRKIVKKLGRGEINLSLGSKPEFDFDQYMAYLCAALDEVRDPKQAKIIADKCMDQYQG